jgi:putative transposase
MAGRSYSQVYFHMVFATKYREPLISYGFEKDLHKFMKKKLEELGCTPLIINGMPDHIHILFRGRREIPISKVTQSVKGASSRWINQNELAEEHFVWQEGYSVFSVSDYHLQIVFQYIKNQKTHHREKSLIPTLEGTNQATRDLSPPYKKGA